MAQTKQALVVDDNKDIADELENALVSFGFKVTVIQDPDKITETLGVHQYEVALVNKSFPETGWRNTLRTVKNASRTTTVMMITQSAGEEDIRNAMSAGTYLVLDRPITPEQITNLISFNIDGLFIVLRD